MPLTDAEIEAVALKDHPTSEVISIDGRMIRPTPADIVAKWSNPKTFGRYGEAKPSLPPKPSASVWLRRAQQYPPVPESFLHHTLLIDRFTGSVIAQSG